MMIKNTYLVTKATTSTEAAKLMALKVYFSVHWPPVPFFPNTKKRGNNS